MGTEWEGGERVKGSTAETARKRPERPWTAARTMEVLRRCPLAIAQRLVHCAIALSTAVLDRVTKTMSVAPLLTNNLDNSKQKTSNLLSPAPPPYSWSLLGKSEGPAPPPSSMISRSFDLAWNPVYTRSGLVSCLSACFGARFLPQSYQYPNLSEGADRVGGQLRWNKECPFSGVTKSGRVWRKVPEGDARSVFSTQTFRRVLTESVDSCAEVKSAPSVA